MHKTYTYLALGDSYTIGEGLPITKSFPYHVCQLLRKKGFHINAPEIIAKTGWTTDELLGAIEDYNFSDHYNIITLLIGVNNQYRGRSVEEYKVEFESLLNKAIELSDKKREHVLVISIPDYGKTPFSSTQDTDKITKEIELYNSVNKAVSIQYKVQYLNITTGIDYKESEEELVVDDKLHPSSIVYEKWAELISGIIKSVLK